MTDLQTRAAQRLADVIPTLSEINKARLLGIAEGMAITASISTDRASLRAILAKSSAQS